MQLRDALRMIETLRAYDSTMPIQTAHMFFLVADNEGAEGYPMKALAEKSGMSQAGCSRNVAALSTSGWRAGKPGLGLVEAFENPFNRREKIVKLTEEGRWLIASIS